MKSTKKSFLMSLVSLMLCFAMLLGTTYAWFTDEVTSGSNRIVAGNLDIDLLMDKTNGGAPDSYVSIAGGQGDIFKEADKAQNSNATLWEPGKTQFAKLAIENKGNLAVKYTAYIDVTDNGLANALECALVTAKAPIPTNAYTNWTAVKTAVGENAIHPVTVGRNTIATGVLDEIVNDVQNERDYVLLAVHMKEEAGNEYQGKDCIIDVTIVATQKDAESDSFDNKYDLGAYTNEPAAAVHETASSKAIAMTTTNSNITQIDGQDIGSTQAVAVQSTSHVAEATVPIIAAQDVMNGLLQDKNADTSKNREMVLNLNVNTKENTVTSVTYEIGVTADITYYTTGSEEATVETGKTVNNLSDYLTATINIGAGLKNVTVTHSGNEMTAMPSVDQTEGIGENGGYYYNKDTGVLTIKSKTFSPFKVSYEAAKSDERMEQENGIIRIVGKDTVYASAEGATQQEVADVINRCINDAQDGDTVKLLKDVAITSNAAGYYIKAAAISIPSGKNIVIDLNEKTITVLEPEHAADGDQYNNDHRWDAAVYAVDIANGATVSIINGTITGDGKFAIWNKGTIPELKNVKCYTNSETFEGTSDGDNITALKNSGTITAIESCEFVGYKSPYAHGIINFATIGNIKNSKIAVDLNNGEMINYNHALYNSSSATIGTVDTCTMYMITNRTSGDKYYNQPYTIDNYGSIHELKDCTVSSYLDSIRNNGTIEVLATGYFDGTLSGGGTFNVTGGLFKAPLSQTVLAENYVPCESGNETYPYTCKYDEQAYSQLTFEAELNGKNYATLSGALAQAKAGDTVKLLSDINSQVVINKAITLDLNGYSIQPNLSSFSYTMQIALAKDDKGTVTLTDSTNSGKSVIGGGANNGYTIQSYQPYTTIDISNITVQGSNGWTITAQQSTINIKSGAKIVGGTYECILCTYNGWIILDGGTIETTKNTAVKLEAPSGYNMQPLFKMTNGTVRVDAQGSSIAALELKSTSDAKAKCQIEGGSISVNANNKSSLYAINDNGNYSNYASDISIKNCTISVTNAGSSATVISGYGLTLENSTITLDPATASSSYAIKCKDYTENQYNTNNNKVIKITNCTITGNTSYASLYTQEITNGTN